VLGLACGISARPACAYTLAIMQTIKKDGRPARAPPTSPSVIRTPISAAAYRAIAVSSMRLLLEQGGSQGGYFFCVDQGTLNKLMAAKKRSENFSDVMIRMAKADATATGRLSLASNRLSLQAPDIYRH
jgi:hypothetical protein